MEHGHRAWLSSLGADLKRFETFTEITYLLVDALDVLSEVLLEVFKGVLGGVLVGSEAALLHTQPDDLGEHATAGADGRRHWNLHILPQGCAAEMRQNQEVLLFDLLVHNPGQNRLIVG